jgi:invasion protein IalB
MLGGASMNRQKRERRHGSLRPRAVIIWAAMLLLTAVSGHAEGQQMPGSASVAKPDDAEVALRGQRAAVRNINYGDWRKFCFKAAGARALCRTSITGTFETGQTAVRLDLIEREDDGGARLQLFLPVGMYLQAGVKLTVDQGAPYRIPYTWCLTNACIAADLADSKVIKEMESGRTLVLEVVDSNILSVTTSLPLGQFASIHQGAPVQTFDQAIDE